MIPGFYSWFLQNKVNTIKSTMLRSIRCEAGLGSPPLAFTTNASETTNSIIKAHVSYKPSQLMEFVNHLKEVVDEQEREVERAVIKRGKYRFRKEYSHLEISEARWFAMTTEQRHIHLKKVAACPVTDGGDNIFLQAGESLQRLSMDVDSVSSLVNVPLPCLKGIWQKASELLASPDKIVAAPGHSPEAKMVASHTGPRPHLVLPCKSGIFKCDNDCLNYKSMGMCSHSVAVANLNGSLHQFISAFSKLKKQPDFTKLSLHGMPSGRGRKGGQAPRQRKKSVPVSDRVRRMTTSDCPSVNVTSVSSSQMVNEMYNSSLNLVPSAYNRPLYYNPYYNLPYPNQPHCSYWTDPYGLSFSCRSPASEQAIPPMAEEESPFKLCFITGNISKCAGCGNKYAKPPVPPYDLCVQHREWRSFVSGSGPQSKFSPAYYHVNILCIQKNWPHFDPSHLEIPREVPAKLTDIHIHFLRSIGVNINEHNPYL